MRKFWYTFVTMYIRNLDGWRFARASAAVAVWMLPSPFARADTPISGQAPDLLALTGSPYVVTANLTVVAGHTLTVEAGVQIKFQDRTALMVNGTLLVNGTPTTSVNFTSATGTQPGKWAGIGVQPGGSATLNHASVRYAGLPGGFPVPGQLPRTAAVFANKGSLGVSNCDISNSGGDGLYYFNDGAAPLALTIIGNSVTTCTGDGVHLDAINTGDVLSVTGNTIAGSGAYAFRVPAGVMGLIGPDNAMSGNAAGDGIAVTTGTVTGAVTLPATGLWHILGQITVPAGATLNVGAGDILRFRGGVKLLVSGALNISGTPYAPAVLASEAGVPTPSTRWAGAYFAEGAIASLANATISGAGYAGSFQIPGQTGYRTASICAYRAEVMMEAVSILDGGGDGVYWYNDGSARTLTVAHGWIGNTGNDGYVVASDTAADTISLSANRVSGVQRYPILIPARRLPNLTGNTLTSNATPAVGISGGTLDHDATLDPGGLYHVLAPVSVAAGTTLGIGAGVTVHFAPDAYLDVLGAVNAQGTPDKVITLTSFWPAPLAGDWGGVALEPGAVGTLNYTSIRYAGQAGAFLVNGVGSVQTGVLVNRASLTASGLTCDSSAGYGLYAYNPSASAHTLTLSGGVFNANQADGIHIHKTSSGDLINLQSVIASGNGADGLRIMTASAPVPMTGLTANGNGGFPVRIPAELLGGIIGPSYNGNTAGDQVALTGGAIGVEVSVNYPIRLLNLVDVPAGAALRLLPGAEVVGVSLSALQVEGTLTAGGTVDAPITFHGPPGALAGAWGGVGVLEGGSAALTHVAVRDAGEANDFYMPSYPGIASGVLAYRADLTLQHASVANCSGNGVMAINDGSKPKTLTLKFILVTGAVGTGLNIISARPDDNVTVAGNSIAACGGAALAMPMRTLYSLGSGNTYQGNAGGDGVRITAGSADTGTLARNAVVPAGTTLFVTAKVGVAAGTTLALGAGVTLRIAGAAAMLVNGSLSAAGLSESPVLFTADSPSPVPGYWGGLAFGGGSTGILNGVEFRYGGASFAGFDGLTLATPLASQNGSVTLNGCLVRDSAGALIVLRGTTGAFTAANSTMVDKASGPHARLVDVAGVGTATFGGAAASGCDFLSAQAGAVTNAGPAVIGARYCYWNAADGPNPPGSGAGIAGAVDTAPYLAAPANPPTAAITSTGSQSRGVITILGTAKSPYYASAVLEVGAGTAPTVFTALAALAAPVAGGVLGYWDASSVADGTYTLRLSVTDRLGRVAQAQSVVVVSTGAPGTGDLNGNGVVDAGDAVLALRMAGGLSVASAESAAAADVRPKPGVAVPFGDGKIAMDDVAAIMAKALNPTMAWP